MPIIFDAILVGLIIHWQRTWKLRKDSAKQDHEKAHDDLLNDIERVSAALLHLKERKEELELKNTALEHLAAVQSKNKKRKDNKKWTDPLREKIGRQKKDKKSSLNEDYHQNWEKMQPSYRDSRTRKTHDELGTSPLLLFESLMKLTESRDPRSRSTWTTQSSNRLCVWIRRRKVQQRQRRRARRASRPSLDPSDFIHQVTYVCELWTSSKCLNHSFLSLSTSTITDIGPLHSRYTLFLTSKYIAFSFFIRNNTTLFPFREP